MDIEKQYEHIKKLSIELSMHKHRIAKIIYDIHVDDFPDISNLIAHAKLEYKIDRDICDLISVVNDFEQALRFQVDE